MIEKHASVRNTPPLARELSRKQWIYRMQFCNVMSNGALPEYNMPGRFPLKDKYHTYCSLFGKHNLQATDKTKVYLNKQEIDYKACVIMEYQITQGTLPHIETKVEGNYITTSLRMPPGFVIAPDATVGNVAGALLQANAGNLSRGDQLLIVHAVQGTVLQGNINIPRANVRLYELGLNPNSAVPLYALLPKHLFILKDGRIAGDATQMEPGGVAYILSRTRASKMLISTQSIVITPGNQIYAAYTSEAKKAEALASLTTAVPYFFDPDASGTRQEYLSPVESPNT